MMRWGSFHIHTPVIKMGSLLDPNPLLTNWKASVALSTYLAVLYGPSTVLLLGREREAI